MKIAGADHHHPCAYVPTIRFKRRIRWFCASTTQLALTINDLLDMWFMATSATTGYRLASAIRLIEVEMWTPSYTSTGIATASRGCSVCFRSAQGDFGDPTLAFADSAMGTDDVAHVRQRPPRNALASQWLSATTSVSQVVTISAAQGSMIDLTVEVSVPEGGSTTPAANPLIRTIAGATTGAIYVTDYPANASTMTAVNVAHL